MRWRPGDQQGGVLAAAVFLFAALLSLLLITACWPALFNQHRQVRLAVDNAGDAAGQVLQAPLRVWAAGVLAEKADRFYRETGRQISDWWMARWNQVYTACMSQKDAKDAECRNEVFQVVAKEYPFVAEAIRYQAASRLFPHPREALAALDRGNPVTPETFTAEVTPRETGCAVQRIASAYRGQMENAARAYAIANGADGIEGFELQTLPDRVQMRFYAVRAIRLPIFARRTGAGDQTKALGIDNFLRLLSLPLDNTGPCP